MISLTPHGLHCEAGGFHIDPNRAVENAFITHAHSDHARRGSKQYYCAESSVALVRARLGQGVQVQGVAFGKQFKMGDTTVSFHPAGHILGSAQVRIQKGADVWVVSGDYKRDADPTCEPFELVPCNTFITEGTFGLPIYRWHRTSEVALEIVKWWRANALTETNSLLYCYSLGKAQRVLAEILPFLKPDEKVLVHDSIEPLSACYREQGIALAPCEVISNGQKGPVIRGALILAPPGIAGTPLMKRIGLFETAFASGWMRVRRSRINRRYDRSFVISDHADWPSLVRTVRETGARQVYVMHGQDDILARYLTELGLNAQPISALKTGGQPRLL